MDQYMLFSPVNQINFFQLFSADRIIFYCTTFRYILECLFFADASSFPCMFYKYRMYRPQLLVNVATHRFSTWQVVSCRFAVLSDLYCLFGINRTFPLIASQVQPLAFVASGRNLLAPARTWPMSAHAPQFRCNDADESSHSEGRCCRCT